MYFESYRFSHPTYISARFCRRSLRGLWCVGTEPCTSHCHETLLVEFNVEWLCLDFAFLMGGGSAPPTPRFSWGLRPHTPIFVVAPPPQPLLGGCAPKPRFHRVNQTLQLIYVPTVSHQHYFCPNRLQLSLCSYVRMFWGFQYQLVLL